MKKIVLASSSLRRKEILENMGFNFEIIPSDYEEVLDSPEFTYEKIENLAYNKAKAVLDKNLPSFLPIPSFILGADTVVVLEGSILGKPENKNEAVKMLKKLSGKKHFVVTSICVINSENSEKKILSQTSYVEFKNLSDKLIENYIEKYKPFDKAGSYGIQELPEGFIKNIEGSFENVIGLCPKSLQTILEDF